MRKFYPALILAALSVPIGTASAGDKATIPEQHARANGFDKCAYAVKMIAEFHTKGKEHAADSSWAVENTSDRIFSSFMEIPYDDDTPSLIDLNISHSKDGTCNLTYTRTDYYPKSCMHVAQNIFSSYKFKGTLSKDVSILQPEDGGPSVYLSSAGSGCLSIKKEFLIEVVQP